MSLFGTDIFTYSTSFAKSRLHSNFNISFHNNKQIIVLTIGYSIKLMVNILIFALTVLRATCLPQKYVRIAPHFQFIYNKVIT